jgi:hypothetical protein
MFHGWDGIESILEQLPYGHYLVSRWGSETLCCCLIDGVPSVGPNERGTEMKETGIEGALEPNTPAGIIWFKRSDVGYDHVTIVFEAYQAGENNYSYALTSSGVNCESVWDSWDDESAYEDAGFTLPERKRMLQAKLLHMTDMHPSDAVPIAGRNDGTSLLVLRGSYEKVRAHVANWLKEVAEDAVGVGGDDSYFDYYPDNFYVAGQLCDVLDLREELKAATMRAVELRYHDDTEDVLGQSFYSKEGK